MARLSVPASNFADCLRIGEAAEYLGVSTATLRNWDRSGKLKPRRHPQNGYRIYLHEDLQAVLRTAELSAVNDEEDALAIDWSKIRDAEHFVQFYEDEEFLLKSVSGFLGCALADGACGVVVATAEHRREIERRLLDAGIDVVKATASGRFLAFDANEMLATFMVDGAPDPIKFHEVIGKLLTQLRASRVPIRAFGEMVAILWAEGNQSAAVALEQLWNELGRRHRFALMCAYPIRGFDGDQIEAHDGVCTCHTRVFPAESFAEIATDDERMRAVAQLQKKARSLVAEIQHREEIQKSLAKRESELSDFFENATEGLHKVGADGTILWANQADYALLGYTAGEYVGQPITDFHADADVIADILAKLQRGESLVNFPARLRCKNGAIKHVRMSSNAYFEDGRLVYTRCFTRDVSQQWQAEKALVDADRRKDEFLATLSHELRNPLAPIRSALELLDNPSCEAGTRVNATSVIHRQVDQMTRLIDDLLDVSRITRDKIELRKCDVELASIINYASETSRPTLEAAGHQLEVLLPTQPVWLHVDPTRLSQVFANLLNNAAKFTPSRGRIRIEAEIDGVEVVIRVSDNGLGISCEALAYVFDMFRQADQSLERSQGGLGIGLTIVRRLVELHGGMVNAQSEGPNKGSEFTVRLPISSSSARSVNERPMSKAAPNPKRRVLVVDDNRDSGDTLALLLRVKGHDVFVAHDGLEAIEETARSNPEIILMDVGMPKLNGYEATRRIRQMPNGDAIFIVALTGWGQASDIARSKEAGCSAHLVKPVDFTALDQLLAKMST
jgi:PAS domain S-box-containing protein